MLATEHERLSKLILEQIEQAPRAGFERTAKSVFRALYVADQPAQTVELLEAYPGRRTMFETVGTYHPMKRGGSVSKTSGVSEYNAQPVVSAKAVAEILRS